MATDELLTDAELAALWRRHFEVYDDLVYGFTLWEGARRAAEMRRWHRRLRRWRPPGWYSLVWEVWHALRVVVPGLVDRFDARRRGCSDREWAARRADPAAVSYSDLCSARHTLSGVRFRRPSALCERSFRASDPLDDLYLGRAETDFARTRREVDSRWEP